MVRGRGNSRLMRKKLKRTDPAAASREIRAIGTFKGRLRRADGSRGRFLIEPSVGESAQCVFQAGADREFLSALGRKVLASGELTYPAGSDFPRSIKIETVEILPEDDELPSLSDLRGIAPDITGDLSSEEFVRRLRDGHE